ncbi:unnamed protein product, partial [Closterium sp. NIES-54]
PRRTPYHPKPPRRLAPRRFVALRPPRRSSLFCRPAAPSPAASPAPSPAPRTLVAPPLRLPVKCANVCPTRCTRDPLASPELPPHTPPITPQFAPTVGGGEGGALGVVAEGEGGGCGGGGNVPKGTSPRPPLYSLSLQRLSVWGKGGCVRGWRERFCRASSRPSSSLSHSRACHCGGEGEAVAEVSQASAAAARCYRGNSNCRPCLHLLFLLLSATVERQVLPLSPAVPPPLAAARSCSPGGLPPHAPTSAASTLAEGLVQLNLPPLHRLPLLLPAVAAFFALGVPLQEVYCTWFQL